MSKVSTDLSEIIVKATMIIGITGDPKVKTLAGDCMAAVGRINESLGLNAAHELMLELTRMLDEHPEEWQGACECPECVGVQS